MIPDSGLTSCFQWRRVPYDCDAACAPLLRHLNTPKRHKNGHDGEERSHSARRGGPPTPAVRPSRQAADQHDNEDDKDKKDSGAHPEKES